MANIRSFLPVGPKYLGLLRSQYATARALESLSQQRLEATLRAAREIPFYRERDAGSLKLSAYPVLKRSDIAALNRSARERAGGGVEIFHDNSSGSTGMPAEFLFDAAHQSGRYAGRIRYLRANGWSPLRPNVWLVAFTSREDTSLDSQIIASRLRLRSTFLRMIFRPFEQQVDRLIELQPETLYTMPSNLDGLLRVFEHRGIGLGSLRCIFTGGEVLDNSLRDRTRQALGVEIRDNYGSTEGFVAWQCPAGSYHINVEHIVVEIVDESGEPAGPGQMGRVLITTIENHLMPLIRYEIGDYAIASDEKCSCGRTLPVLGKVIGRGINLFHLPDGKLKSPWPLVGPIKARAEIKQFQIVQETRDHFVLRYVSECELSQDVQTAIGARFNEILEIAASVGFERTDSIARTAGGKFMTALSMVRD